MIKEIKITDIEGFQIGNAQNEKAGTGCTVVLCKKGMAAGLDVRGGGPASRESELLTPAATAQEIHGLLLSGGSAFGLDAAGGVMKYLEEHGIGFDVGVTRVPLVCQSCLFDLTVGDPFVRPDSAMAYKACEEAQKNHFKNGNFGAGTGATVGKLNGMDNCMKSGIGSYAVQMGEFKMGAIVAVNALGDIFDYKSGEILAGLYDEESQSFLDSESKMLGTDQVFENRFVGNTTIGAILTNGDFDKARLGKIAAMAHNGYARSIRPVHTSADGDSIYALSTRKVAADEDMAGTLGAKVMSEAITLAVKSAESAYGYRGCKEKEK